MEYNVNIFILYITANPACRMLAESSSQLCFLFILNTDFLMLLHETIQSTRLFFLTPLIGWLVEALLSMVSEVGQYRSRWIWEGQSLELPLIITVVCDIFKIAL